VIRVLVSAASPTACAELMAVIDVSPGLKALRGAAGLTSLAHDVDRIRPDVVLLIPGSMTSVDEIVSFLSAGALDYSARSKSKTSNVLQREDSRASFIGGFAPAEAPGLSAVVILAESARDPSVIELLRQSVHAILPLDSPSDVIVAAVRLAAAGLKIIDADAFDLLLSAEIGAESPAPEMWLEPRNQTLTPRETEVLRMIAEGLGNKEIAWHLRVSEHTVKFHISSIFNKLDVSSRTEAVTVGVRRGLILI
jgi:NarL family two-component system response regulator YdfI